MKRTIAILFASIILSGCGEKAPFAPYSQACLSEQQATRKVYGKPDAMTSYIDRYGMEAIGWRYDTERVSFLFVEQDDCKCRVTKTTF
jgi:PBP1b-binding outer membrane lipoprotein LpoB